MNADGIKNDFLWLLSPLEHQFLIVENETVQSPIVPLTRLQHYFSELLNEHTLDHMTHAILALPLHTYSLGRYFERLLFECLKTSTKTEFLVENLGVHAPHHTLGELDVVFRDCDTQVVYHWEVAFKYYLKRGVENSLNDFVGPAARDTLVRKLTHIRDKQLPVVSSPEGRAVLKSFLKSDDEAVSSEVLLFGMMFYEGQKRYLSSPSICGLNPFHKRGWWIFSSQCEQETASQPQSRWFISNRKDWRQSARLTLPPETTNLLSTTELCEQVKVHFQTSDHPILVLEVAHDSFHEISRGFIIP